MRTFLLGVAAACAVVTLPAGAQAQWRDSQGGLHSDHRGGDRMSDRHRHDDRLGETVFVVDGGEWAAYNNQSWQSDSFNDWWHDRPDRAFPRWVQHNQNCERIWWSGAGWRC